MPCLYGKRDVCQEKPSGGPGYNFNGQCKVCDGMVITIGPYNYRKDVLLEIILDTGFF